jgi:hypothetical protein
VAAGAVVACVMGGTYAMLIAPATAAFAVTGPCTAQATFSNGTTYDSATASASDVVKVPQSDRPAWKAALTGAAPPSSDVSSGDITVESPVGGFKIFSWSKHFGVTSESGTKHYNFPSVLDNIKIPVKGHENDNGRLLCSGSATIEVVGSTFKNPLSFISIGGLAVGLAGLGLAGLRRKA